MGSYLIRRLILIIPSIFLVTVIVFILIRMVPGDVIKAITAQNESGAAELGLTPEKVRHQLGLDVPIHIQYVRWMGKILRGDFGTSLWSARNVTAELRNRVPVSIELGILALIIGQIIAVPIGVYSAIRQDTVGDLVGRSLAIAFLCIPNFWLATLVMVYPAKWWGWMPPSQYVSIFDNPAGNLALFLWPALIMGLHSSGTTMRMTRTMMLEVLRQDYIRTAWAKGLRERAVIIRHAFKNAIIPVVTIVGMQIPILVAGTVVIEQIFNLPGMGRLMLEALNTRDFPVVSGVNLVIASFVLVNNLAVDLSYAYFDPRIRYK